MPVFTKKPVDVEAMLLASPDVTKDICDWIHSASHGNVGVTYDEQGNVNIETLEGTMRADIGDWVIRGVKGEFYPCKPDVFEETYDGPKEAWKPRDHIVDWAYQGAAIEMTAREGEWFLAYAKSRIRERRS